MNAGIVSGVLALISNVGIGLTVGLAVGSAAGSVAGLAAGSLHWDVLESREFLISVFWSDSKFSGVALVSNVGLLVMRPASDFDRFLIPSFRFCANGADLGVMGNCVASRRVFESSHRDGSAGCGRCHCR